MSNGHNHNTAIRVESVSLSFHINPDRPTSIKEAVVRRLLGRKAHADLFWALQDVSFSVQKGERLGILGLNGSGKTTLLSLIAGIYDPDQGHITTQGRVVGLLGLGVGFDIQMTGLENIAFNASLYGLSRREIEEETENIIAFADIGEFIGLPVKTYSSGMVARLGFAVAAHLNADIILLDEVLTVGDAQFRKKCLARMDSLREQNKTIVFVSHDVASMREMCHTAIWLEKGHLIASGDAPEIIDAYEEKYTPKNKR